MTARELIVRSNEWDHPWSWEAVSTFWHLYPWSIAFLILLLAMSIGFWRTEQIAEGREDERDQRRAEFLVRDRQFCEAIPSAAEASAQALVNIVVADDIRNGEPESEIQATRELGVLYVAEARRLAEENLPECKKLLSTP